VAAHGDVLYLSPNSTKKKTATTTSSRTFAFTRVDRRDGLFFLPTNVQNERRGKFLRLRNVYETLVDGGFCRRVSVLSRKRVGDRRGHRFRRGPRTLHARTHARRTTRRDRPPPLSSHGTIRIFVFDNIRNPPAKPYLTPHRM